MHIKLIQFWTSLFLAAFLFAISIFEFALVYIESGKLISSHDTNSYLPQSKELSEIDNVAKIHVASRSILPISSLADPFQNLKKANAANAYKNPFDASSIKREKLSLTAILMYKIPYAVLQDPTGKSWICSQGDTVKNMRVTKIDKNRILLSDAWGTVELKPTSFSQGSTTEEKAQ